MKYLLITSMRNEAPYILEWLAYHKAIGFNDFLIYSNDCEDGTDLMLDRLQKMGVLKHVRNDKITKAGIQWTALKRASNHRMTSQAEWILFADVDEFVNIKAGQGHLDDLISAVPDATAFALMWRLFGNNGRIEIQDEFVINQFTKCARFPCYAPLTASMFKTLFKNNGTYEKLGVHRPKKRVTTNPENIKWVNGSGQLLPDAYHDDSAFTYGTSGGINLACINHYSLKSAKAFIAKTKRGLPNRSHKQIDLSYWVDRNFNQVEETSIQRMLEPTLTICNEWLTDDVLSGLHNSGLIWHQKCANLALQDTDTSRLYTRIASLTRSDLHPKFAASLGQVLIRARQKEHTLKMTEKNNNTKKDQK